MENKITKLQSNMYQYKNTNWRIVKENKQWYFYLFDPNEPDIKYGWNSIYYSSIEEVFTALELWMKKKRFEFENVKEWNWEKSLQEEKERKDKIKLPDVLHKRLHKVREERQKRLELLIDDMREYIDKKLNIKSTNKCPVLIYNAYLHIPNEIDYKPDSFSKDVDLMIEILENIKTSYYKIQEITQVDDYINAIVSKLMVQVDKYVKTLRKKKDWIDLKKSFESISLILGRVYFLKDNEEKLEVLDCVCRLFEELRMKL